MNELSRFMKRSSAELEKWRNINFSLCVFLGLSLIFPMVLLAFSFHTGNLKHSILGWSSLLLLISGCNYAKQQYQFFEIVLELKKIKANQTPSPDSVPPSGEA